MQTISLYILTVLFLVQLVLTDISLRQITRKNETGDKKAGPLSLTGKR